jgi:hypothetical protein
VNIIRDVLIVVTVLAWLAGMPATWAYFTSKNRLEEIVYRMSAANVLRRAILITLALAVTQALLSAGVVGAP